MYRNAPPPRRFASLAHLWERGGGEGKGKGD